jgi:hypothetical protein
MAAKMEERRAFLTAGRESPYLDRITAALVDRWRSDEPMECDAWELPDGARGEHHPAARVVVLGDGTVIPAHLHEPGQPGELRPV